MNEERIAETYEYPDGPVVRVSDAAYGDKTPEQLRLVWEAANAAAMDCLKWRGDAAAPDGAFDSDGTGKD